MAITNLTNTIWSIPAGWTCSADYGVFDISGKLAGYANNILADEDGFLTLEFGFRLTYGDSGPTPIGGSDSIIYTTENGYSTFEFWPSHSLILAITGGDDVTNTQLISWLEANGTQITMSDLTNTTWNIPAGWTCDLGYGQFNVVFNGKEILTSSGQEIDIYSDELKIGYMFASVAGGEFRYYATHDCMYFGGANRCNNEFRYVFSFTGGEDVTNVDLIFWLLIHATQVIEEPPSSKETYFSIMSELAQTIAEKTGAELPLSIDEMIDALAPKKYTVTVKAYMENAYANIFQTYLSANGESLYVDCDTRLYHNGTEVTSKEYILNDVEEVVISRQGSFGAYRIDDGYTIYLDNGIFGGLDVNSVTIPITKDTVIYIGGGD